MRKPGGHVLIVDPGDSWGVRSAPVERDTITCAHCQRIVDVKPGTGSTVYYVRDRTGRVTGEEDGAFCRLCMAPICLDCHTDGGCTPWERRLERYERRERLMQAVRDDRIGGYT